MVAITLSEEQARQLQASTDDAVPIVDRDGNLMGYFHRPAFTAEEIAEANRRANSSGPWYTTKELLERLSKLEKQA